MSVPSYLRRLLRALLDRPEPEAERLALARHGPRAFTGAVGETRSGVCTVAVYRERGLAPAPGAQVVYRVVQGPASFDGGRRSAVAHTDANGVASCAVRLEARGASILTAELEDVPGSVLPFGARTDGVTHELVLAGAPTFPADPGEIRVAIAATDFREDRVTGASLVIEARRAGDVVVEGAVRELGGGAYEGVVRVGFASEWKVVVQDRTSGVLAERCVHVLAGAPAEIRLVGTTDPRAEPPRDRLLLRAQLLDGRGNPLDPGRLFAESGGRPLPGVAYRDEARFPVSFAGYGSVPVVLRDTGSDVVLETAVGFAAAIVDAPGFVGVGDAFRTRVWAFPEPGRPVRRASIEIDYDERFTSYVRVDRERLEGPGVEIAVEKGPGRLTLAVESEHDVVAEDHPGGIYVCTLEWQCTGEGLSCFSTSARMSPTTVTYDSCAEQKQAAPKPLCVRVIHREKDAAAKAAGDTAADQIAAVIGSKANVGRCCPAIAVTKTFCEISDADYAAKVVPAIAADGTDAISSNADFAALVATRLCAKDKCLNIYILPFDDPAAGGLTFPGTGPTALDPRVAVDRTNVGAHEAAHAFGVSDAYTMDATGAVTNSGPNGNLMSVGPSPDYNHGTILTRDQCKTVFDGIDAFSG